jgi:hypothetical protein
MSAAAVETEHPPYDLILWHLLIGDTQDYWQATGEWPVAVWRGINRRDYRAARTAMDQLMEETRAVATRATPDRPKEDQ